MNLNHAKHMAQSWPKFVSYQSHIDCPFFINIVTTHRRDPKQNYELGEFCVWFLPMLLGA